MAENTAYAIIQTGSKQYRVAEGDIIDVDLLGVETGQVVEFNQVLFVSQSGKQEVGLPYVNQCVVKGELMGEVRGDKVVAYKYSRRANYRRKVGHRQDYSRVKITSIAR